MHRLIRHGKLAATEVFERRLQLRLRRLQREQRRHTGIPRGRPLTANVKL